MKDLVEYIVKALVDNKESVVVEEYEDGNATIVKVHVAETDLGKVIGKNGRIATSIRNIVKSLSSKNRKRYIVKIGDR